MSPSRQPTFSPWPPSEHSGYWRPQQPARAIDIDFRLPHALLYAREAGLQRIRPYLRRRGLTEAGWRLLRTLESADRPLTQTEIARLAGGTDTNARLAARRLVARGQAVWVDDPGPGHRSNDWRSGPWLTLGQGGRDVIFRVRHLCRVNFIDPSRHLSAAKRRALTKGLAHIIRACGAAVPVALPPPPFYPNDDDPQGWTAEAVHDLDLGLPLVMKHTRVSLLGLVRPILAEHGLSEPQWRLLRLLEFWGSGVSQRGLIRSGCFLGPEARHALRAISARGLVTQVRASARVKVPKRFKLRLSLAGKRMIAAVEAAEYARHGAAMARLTAGVLAKMNPLLDAAAEAWLWAPDQTARRTHPLDRVYAQQEEAGRIAAERLATAKRRERDQVHVWDRETGRVRSVPREDWERDVTSSTSFPRTRDSG